MQCMKQISHMSLDEHFFLRGSYYYSTNHVTWWKPQVIPWPGSLKGRKERRINEKGKSETKSEWAEIWLQATTNDNRLSNKTEHKENNVHDIKHHTRKTITSRMNQCNNVHKISSIKPNKDDFLISFAYVLYVSNI